MAAARALMVLVVAWSVAGPPQPPSSLGQPPAPGSCRPVVVGNPEGNYIVPGVKGAITYRVVDGNALQLDAFVPPGARGRPAVVLVHGGGYTAGSRVAHVGQLLELLADAGLPWFSVDYRLGGEAHRESAIDDVTDAVSFVRCQAARFGIDGDRIVLLGEDTGADIALALLQRHAQGVVGAALIGGRFDAAALARPALGATVLFVHGSDDDEQPIAGIRARCRPDVSAERCAIVEIPGGIHRSENWRPSQWGYKEPLVAWIDRTGRPPGRRPNSRACGRPRTPGRGRAGCRGARSSGPPFVRSRRGLHKRLMWDAARGLTLDAWVPATAGRPPARAARPRRRLGGRRPRHLHHAAVRAAREGRHRVGVDRLPAHARPSTRRAARRPAPRDSASCGEHAAAARRRPRPARARRRVGQRADGHARGRRGRGLVARRRRVVLRRVRLRADGAPMPARARSLARLFDRHVLDDESRRRAARGIADPRGSRRDAAAAARPRHGRGASGRRPSPTTPGSTALGVPHRSCASTARRTAWRTGRAPASGSAYKEAVVESFRSREFIIENEALRIHGCHPAHGRGLFRIESGLMSEVSILNPQLAF